MSSALDYLIAYRVIQQYGKDVPNFNEWEDYAKPRNTVFRFYKKLCRPNVPLPLPVTRTFISIAYSTFEGHACGLCIDHNTKQIHIYDPLPRKHRMYDEQKLSHALRAVYGYKVFTQSGSQKIHEDTCLQHSLAMLLEIDVAEAVDKMRSIRRDLGLCPSHCHTRKEESDNVQTVVEEICQKFKKSSY